MDKGESPPILAGVPDSALFVALPLLANFAVLSWFTGYCQALAIPLWYISISAVQLFIVALFSLPLGWLALVSYLTLKRRGKTQKFDENASVRATLLGLVAVIVLVLSYVWGYAVPFATTRWSVVVGTAGCAILTRIGDNVIASDYDTRTRRLRGRLTLYAIGAVPTIDVYRVELDLRGGTAPLPPERPSNCPKAHN
jgi:hypothetical protein